MYYVENRKYPSPFVSLLPIVVLIILLFFTIRLFGADALGGGSQICLLVTTALCAGIGMVGYHIPWKDIEHAIVNNIAGGKHGPDYSVDYRSTLCCLDVEWGSSYFDLLWSTGYSSEVFSGFLLYNLCCCVSNDWQFLDYHCYYWYCFAGNW